MTRIPSDQRGESKALCEAVGPNLHRGRLRLQEWSLVAHQFSRTSLLRETPTEERLLKLLANLPTHSVQYTALNFSNALERNQISPIEKDWKVRIGHVRQKCRKRVCSQI